MSERPGESRRCYIDVEVLQRLLKGLDFIILALGGLAITFSLTPRLPGNDAPIGFFVLGLTFLSMLAMRSLGLYDIASLRNGIPSILLSIVTCSAGGAFGYLLTRLGLIDLPFQWLSTWIGLTALHLAITRGIVTLWTRPLERAGRFRKRIAIVGGGKAAEEAIHTLEASAGLDIDIVGLFDDRYDDRSPQSIRTHRKLGKISELAQFARQDRIDLVIVAIPLSAEARLLQILKRLWELPVDIRISGQASRLKLSPRAYTQLGNLPLLSVFDRPLTGWSSFLKSAMDRSLAALLIVLLSPLLLLTALAVRLDSKGPILFKQRRYGFNNELIEVYKFRSMHVDRSDGDAARLVSKGDPRVTPVGRIIRKTSLDELPQLFNVLSGQLSLVGPRPHATQAKAQEALYEQVVDGYFARHRVKPGITGWAQINGWRGETDTKEKIEQRVLHDLDYIDHWSLGFDLYILIKTPLALLKLRTPTDFPASYTGRYSPFTPDGRGIDSHQLRKGSFGQPLEGLIMDIVSLIIQLVLGAVGGNAGGAVVKNSSLGTAGNSVVGAIGGVILGQILERMTGAPVDPAATAAAANGMGDIIQNVIGGAAGGAILQVIAGLIKNSMSKA